MAGSAIKFEKHKGGYAIVTMNKPEVHNAMDQEVMDGLEDAWRTIRDDPEIIVGIVTGAGEKSFSAGGNLKTFIPKATEQKFRPRFDMEVASILKGSDFWKPMIG